MYLGIDLGGTNIAVGLVNEQGKILEQDSVPTQREREPEEIIRDMVRLCRRVTEKAGDTLKDVKAIGVGSPGSVDNKTGTVIYANNLKMKNTPVAAQIQKYIGLPVNVENDADAAAYGEYIVNGNGARSFLCITLGTGIGGGIILNGQIYRTFNSAGTELGHSTLVHDGILCGCGKRGCWEAYASVTALIRQTKEAIQKYPESLMGKLAEERKKVSGRTAFEAAKQGDPAAKAVVNTYLSYVADGITNMVNIFQPEKLVIGGGISKEGERLLKPVRAFEQKYGYNKDRARTNIQAATLFNDAGIIGAALAARDKAKMA